MTSSLSRRDLLRTIGVAMGASPILAGQESKSARDSTSPEEYMTRLGSVYHESDSRPEFVWMNREGVFYHDLDYPSVIAQAPEYFCFLRKAWVFNRAMEWIREEGTILSCEPVGELPLTGEKQVSAWFTGTDNKVIQEGEYALGHLPDEPALRHRLDEITDMGQTGAAEKQTEIAMLERAKRYCKLRRPS